MYSDVSGHSWCEVSEVWRGQGGSTHQTPSKVGTGNNWFFDMHMCGNIIDTHFACSECPAGCTLSRDQELSKVRWKIKGRVKTGRL